MIERETVKRESRDKCKNRAKKNKISILGRQYERKIQARGKPKSAERER